MHLRMASIRKVTPKKYKLHSKQPEVHANGGYMVQPKMEAQVNPTDEQLKNMNLGS